MFFTKHIKFSKECEYRLIHITDNENDMEIQPIKQDTKTVKGKEQIICKIPLQANSLDFDNNNTGISLDLNTILEKIIIGPCSDPDEMARTFQFVLEAARIKDATSKIEISGIPLRT